MKIYRAIEFSQLIWLSTAYATLEWESLSLNGNGSKENWWFLKENIETRRQIIKDICENSNESFFQKSLDYNAMQGGRFNPSKSFGVIYTSSNPLVSTLEVLFHKFNGALPMYSKMRKENKKFISSFNVNIPEKLDTLIISFEIEIDDDLCSVEICDNESNLKSICEKIGFERYIGDNFSRDFIFGNDYEISRLIGSYMHTSNDATFKVPSARIDYVTQDENFIRNYIIPEKNYSSDKIRLTGNFYEYRCNIDLEKSDNKHSVRVLAIGKDTEEELYFSLDPVPSKRYTKDQFIRYVPNTENPQDRKNYYREVELQKFNN